MNLREFAIVFICLKKDENEDGKFKVIRVKKHESP